MVNILNIITIIYYRNHSAAYYSKVDTDNECENIHAILKTEIAFAPALKISAPFLFVNDDNLYDKCYPIFYTLIHFVDFMRRVNNVHKIGGY